MWASSARVHEVLCRRAVSYGAIRTVRRLGLFAGDQPDALRLHDIAWAATNALRPPVHAEGVAFATALDTYVRELSSDDSGTLTLNQLSRVHQAILARLVHSSDRRNGHLYAWLHHPGPGDVKADNLPDPVAFARDVLERTPDDFAVQTAAELAEAALRLRLKERAEDGSALSEEDLLLPFVLLDGSSRIGETAKYHVRHHYAKALKRLKRWKEATDVCERLLHDAGRLPSTRLLLARTLSEYPWAMATSETGARARELLFGLLDDAYAAPREASVSVTLAAAELLRRNSVQADFAHVFAKYGALLEALISDASRRGLEQATQAFGALGAEWAKRDVAGFRRVFEAVPVPSADSIVDWDELTAWGEVLKAAAEIAPSPERERLLELALEFFKKPQKRYAATHLADTLTLLGRPSEAVRTLDELVERDAKANSDSWVVQRRSEAFHALGDEPKALADAARAIDGLRDSNRHTPYLLKWYARRLVAAGRVEDAEKQLARLKRWLDTNGRMAEWSDAHFTAILQGH